MPGELHVSRAKATRSSRNDRKSAMKKRSNGRVKEAPAGLPTALPSRRDLQNKTSLDWCIVFNTDSVKFQESGDAAVTPVERKGVFHPRCLLISFTLNERWSVC